VRPVFTLFGLAAKNPRASGCHHLNQVPVSSLKLRLTGLLASSNPARSIAIIEKEISRLALASAIPSRGTMRGSPILPDRIIVNYQGRKEAILLFNDTARAVVIARRRGHSAPVKRLREQPQNILTYLSISPVLSGDKLQGYRLIQAKTPRCFASPACRK
jgi:general secretion pathway protein C